ncbi:TRAP transporter substrate-binding protein DctP [Polaromonas sp. P1(28)-13]|nr:TRAP transporter substrate-binding protein DctP [Polaromonas sp. P1(28)-13]
MINLTFRVGSLLKSTAAGYAQSCMRTFLIHCLPTSLIQRHLTTTHPVLSYPSSWRMSSPASTATSSIGAGQRCRSAPLAARKAWNLTAILALIVATTISVPAQGKNLQILVPLSVDEATRTFLSTLATAPEIVKAELTFTHVSYDAVGPLSESVNLLKNGKVSLALLPATLLPGFPDGEALTYTSLLSHPSILRDASEQFYVQDSVIGDLVNQELGRKGFVVVSFWNMAATSLVVTRQVRSMADFKNLKISAPDQQSRELLATLGATPVNTAFSKVHQAIQSGEIDASEARLEREKPSLLEVAKGGSVLADFRHTQGFLLAGEQAWINLTQKERMAIQSAAVSATKQARSMVLTIESSLPASANRYGLMYAKFSGLNGISSADFATSVWLRSAGSAGPQALKLLTEVKRTKPPTPKQRGLAPSGSKGPTRILFATNRNDEGTSDLSSRFGISRDPNSKLTCGEVAYVRDSGRSFGAPHRGDIGLVGSNVKRDIKACVDLAIDVAKGSRGSIVLFVHGFNKSFDSAIRQAIGLAQDLAIDDPVLVWAWPSQDRMSGYNFDGASVEFSRSYFKGFSAALFPNPAVKQVSVIAHSMGSRIGLNVLEHSFQAKKALANIVFVAPDVPQSIFRQGIMLYGKSARLATLYANQHDRTLAVSEYVNREPPAGQAGASLLVMEGVETVDVSRTDDEWDELNHSHGFDVPKVAADVSSVLLRKVSATS